MNNKKTYFITGGGTGGHIYPAVAVADELFRLSTTEKIFYVGNPNNLEASIVKDKNFEFLPVISSGMPRKVSFEFIIWVFKMIHAWFVCCKYIYKFKPNAIFGTGGYVSAPVLFAGITMRVPFVMHDCDANPGLVTRKLAPFAKSISVAFDVAKTKLNNPRCFTNGNPIRTEFRTLTKEKARANLGLEDKLTICIMGGSQGAKAINDATLPILKTLSQTYKLQIILQTGKRNYDEVIENLKQLYPEFEQDKNLIIKPYFEDMVTVLKACDIAVSRAGSLSISELCACNIAPIFVPYPYAAADHQRINAKFMVQQGAGLYLENEDTNPVTLLEKILELVNNSNRLRSVQISSARQAVYNAVDKIVSQITSI